MTGSTNVSWFHRTAYEQLGRRGLELRRHSATRRQRVFDSLGVDLVLDVGAAEGGYGAQLRKFGYAGRIVSFEPLTGAWERLQRRIADDGSWTAHHVALGESTTTATINVASNSDSSSLLPMLDTHREAAPEVDYVAQEEIAVSTLDELAGTAAASSRAPFLKVDTQGFERQVLAGAPETVRHLAGLQLELSFVPLYEGGMLVDEAIGWAYRHGFHLVGMEQGYAAPSGEILQMDGTFVRDRD